MRQYTIIYNMAHMNVSTVFPLKKKQKHCDSPFAPSETNHPKVTGSKSGSAGAIFDLADDFHMPWNDRRGHGSLRLESFCEKKKNGKLTAGTWEYILGRKETSSSKPSWSCNFEGVTLKFFGSIFDFLGFDVRINIFLRYVFPKPRKNFWL